MVALFRCMCITGKCFRLVAANLRFVDNIYTKSHKNNHEFRITLWTQSSACWSRQAERDRELWVLLAADVSIITIRRRMKFAAILTSPSCYMYVLEEAPPARRFKDPRWTQAHFHLHSSESLKENRERCYTVNTCGAPLRKNTVSISSWNCHMLTLWY